MQNQTYLRVMVDLADEICSSCIELAAKLYTDRPDSTAAQDLATRIVLLSETLQDKILQTDVMDPVELVLVPKEVSNIG